MVAGCIYKHPKQTILNFLDNLPLLEKLSHENKQTLIMGDFNINPLNYDGKNTANFPKQNVFLILIYLLSTHSLE